MSDETKQDAAAEDQTDVKTEGQEAVETEGVDGEGDEELSELEQAERDRDHYKDQLYRAAAEMENAKKRAQRDVEAANKYGPLSFIRDLTVPLDNLQRALESAPADRDGLDETYKNILIGLEMTVSEVTKIMEKHGVTLVHPEGEKFDYNLHQAMFEVPTNDVAPGTVVSVAQAGYVLYDRLIRPAMVGVSKAAPEESAE